ncbi:hypothetical protein A9Q99_03655 [Gammaproteobacteria bacterium 45_16_T64]|nr:hypothetical protein A9Q99_03655 [Gammaproteobacteria bacterium 45_16_T64]
MNESDSLKMKSKQTRDTLVKAPKKLRENAPRSRKKNVVVGDESVKSEFPLFHVFAAFFVFCLMSLGLLFGNNLINGLFSNYPIKTVKVIGEFRFVERQKLEKVLNIYLTDNFFQVDLDSVKEKAEALPWIEQAWVKKSWPDTVELTLQERRPLASWGKGQLISERKEIFDGERIGQLDKLPTLYGADDYASLIVDRFLDMESLLSSIDLSIQTIELEERFSWRVVLREGITLVISEERCLEKLNGFVGLYQRMPELDRTDIKQVDLRYDNGLAIKWKKKNGNSDAA